MDWIKSLFYALLAIVFCCSDVDSWKIFHRGRGRVYSEVETNSIDNEDEWFEQRLDHFDAFHNATWNQRYFSNSDHYKPGGPVFLMIGGEGPANPVWMHQGNWIDLAKKFNAYLFYLEHRFYGKSHPTQSLDVSYLAYLSSEQALSDLAYFVTKMKAKLQMKKSRWIAFGGSYPGNLAAWARLKYPHLIHAAIASSAPVQAKLNFKDYLASVSISLGDKCSQAINIATKEIEKRILNNERKSLRKDLKLCDDIYLKETNDVSNLFETLAGNFEGIVQYNKGNRKFEGAKGTNLTIDLICNTLTLYPGKEYEQYQDVTRIILEAYNQSCLDFKYSKMLKDMRKTSWNSSVSEGGRQWLYQTCTEFGYYQTSDNLNQPFGKNFSLEFSTKQCRDIFGKKFTDSSIKDGIKATNINYGGLSFKASRVLFVNGAIDPWHVLSFTKSVRPGKENRVEAVLIPTMKQSTLTQFLAKKNKNKSDSSSDFESVVKLDSSPSSSESSDDEETAESSSTDNQEARKRKSSLKPNKQSTNQKKPKISNKPRKIKNRNKFCDKWKMDPELDTSHCADMYPSRDEDTNELKEARQVILQTISRWLKKKA